MDLRGFSVIGCCCWGGGGAGLSIATYNSAYLDIIIIIYDQLESASEIILQYKDPSINSCILKFVIEHSANKNINIDT